MPQFSAQIAAAAVLAFACGFTLVTVRTEAALYVAPVTRSMQVVNANPLSLHVSSNQGRLNQNLVQPLSYGTEPKVEATRSTSALAFSTAAAAMGTVLSAALWLGKRNSSKDHELLPLVHQRSTVLKAAPAELPPTQFPATGTEFDVVVIGSGPGGEAAAVLASQLGAKVAVLEKRAVFGGPTGLTSKAVRHAIKTILQTAATLGGDKDEVVHKLWSEFPDLLTGAQLGQASESRERLSKNKVQLIIVDDVKLSDKGTTCTITRGSDKSVLKTKKVIVATGSRPARPASIPFTEDKIVDATELPQVLGKKLPDSIGIIGGGVIGVEYGLVLSSVGVKATIFTKPELFMRMLPEILRNEVEKTLKESNIEIVTAPIEKVEDAAQGCSVTAGGKKYDSDLILYTMGRDANSDDLGLEEIGVKFAKYGRIAVDENCKTSLSNVFAVGDVVGTGLASLASKAGRAVAKYIFQGITEEDAPELFGERVQDVPLTLWTVPEMSSVGASVESLRAEGLLPAAEGGPIVVGNVKYSDLVQGRLAGGEGFVQLIAQYCPKEKCHRIIGAHMLGAYANDLIQVAAMLIHNNSSLELVANTPWAAVTMSVLLQHAADDALNGSPYVEVVKKVAA